MKKVFALILSLILVVLCFASCKEETLVYYDYDDMGEYISVSQYKGLEFPQSSMEIIDKIQAKYHSDMQKYNLHSSAVMPSGTKVKEGDTVYISYVGKKDGVAFAGGTSEGTNLVIGSDQFIDGFEDGLIGVPSGKTVTLNLTFPKDYHNAELRGQDVVFTVTVKTVTRNVYPTLSSIGETMAQEMGFENLAAYEKSVIGTVKTEYIWTNKIISLSTVAKFPEKELKKNTTYYETLYQNLVSTYGADTVAAAVKTNAENRTKEELIGYYIAQKENIKVDEEELIKKVKEIYGEGYTAQELENTRLNLVMDKVIDFVMESVVVK